MGECLRQMTLGLGNAPVQLIQTLAGLDLCGVCAGGYWLWAHDIQGTC